MSENPSCNSQKTDIINNADNEVIKCDTINNNDDIKEENSNKPQEEHKISEKSPKFTFRQKVSLVMLATVDFMSFCSMSIMAPFYPQEAALKGMSESMAGFVFGFYAFVIFISSPLFGKIIPKLGVKFLFISGVTTSGVCSILFGTLHTVDNYSVFTALSFIIRGLEALGASAYSTAGYVIIVNIFPDNAGAVRGLLETFVGLGMSVGPAIGGLLFAMGGFGLPFYVIGVFIILIAPLNIYLLPSETEHFPETKSGSITSLLKLPSVIVTCLIMIVVAMTWGFLDPTLEPHLRKFKLSPGNIGLIFLLMSATYGICSPAWGWVTDRLVNYRWLMTLGLYGNSISLLLLGPSPILYFMEDSIGLNIVALSLIGVFVAMALMPTYQAILDSALEGGFAENLGTHSVIAGLWSCVYSLGEVLGPIIGGTLLENFNFPITATFFASLNIITATISLCYYSRKQHSVLDCLSQIKENRKETYKPDTCTISIETSIIPEKNILKNGFIPNDIKNK